MGLLPQPRDLRANAWLSPVTGEGRVFFQRHGLRSEHVKVVGEHEASAGRLRQTPSKEDMAFGHSVSQVRGVVWKPGSADRDVAPCAGCRHRFAIGQIASLKGHSVWQYLGRGTLRDANDVSARYE